MNRKLSTNSDRINIHPIGAFRIKAAYPYRMRSAYRRMELLYYYTIQF